jgi:hypothetical protein
MNWRQVGQSLLQFLTVLISNLVVYKTMPRTIDEWWQPVIQALSATVAIYAGSKLGTNRRATDPGGANYKPLRGPQAQGDDLP